ncbi:MAG: AI-2E family transporter, partial [Acidimicrobiia bacterium]|nr:AI-2E family transporter [Acidimicrobiia bacterium]
MANPSDSTEDRAFVRRTLVVAGTLIAVAAVLWLISALSNILFMIFVALFIAIALEPPVFWLSEKGWRRGAAAGLVFLAGFLLVGLFVVALVPLFAGQINQLANSIPGYIADLFEFMEANLGLDLSGFEPETAGQDAVGFIQSLGGTLIGGIVEVTAGIAGFFVFGTTVALFSFYMVAEMPKLQSTVLSFMER